MRLIATLRPLCLPRRTSGSPLKSRPHLRKVLVERVRHPTTSVPCGNHLLYRPWHYPIFQECVPHRKACSMPLLPSWRVFLKRTGTFFALSLISSTSWPSERTFACH